MLYHRDPCLHMTSPAEKYPFLDSGVRCRQRITPPKCQSQKVRRSGKMEALSCKSREWSHWLSTARETGCIGRLYIHFPSQLTLCEEGKSSVHHRYHGCIGTSGLCHIKAQWYCARALAGLDNCVLVNVREPVVWRSCASGAEAYHCTNSKLTGWIQSQDGSYLCRTAGPLT